MNNTQAIHENINSHATDDSQTLPRASDLRNMEDLRFSVFQATDGTPLSKSFLLENSALIKSPGGNMTRGTGKIQEVRDLQGFADFLKTLTPQHALAYGIPRKEQASWEHCTQSKWKAMGKTSTHLPRTKEMFHFPNGPGIFQMDYDPEDQPKPMTPELLMQCLAKIFPPFGECGWASKPSNSSGIMNTDTGNSLTSNDGFRIYIAVENARLIPEAAKLIEEGLWGHNLGWIKISKSGYLLERSLIDMAVYQANRLDFAGPPHCEYPLTSPRIQVTVHEGNRLDLSSLEHLNNEVPRAAKEYLAARQAERRKDTDKQSEKYISAQARQYAGADASADEIFAVEQSLKRALRSNVLGPDFILNVETEDQIESVSVDDILADPARFHGCMCRDPLEPEYHAGDLVGKIYLNGGSPNIHSFAHGGRVYKLSAKYHRLQVIDGRTADLVDQTVRIISNGDWFNFGDKIARVHNQKIETLDGFGLAYDLSQFIQYYTVRTNQSGRTEKDVDPPLDMRNTLASLCQRLFDKPLEAVVTHPIIAKDGRLLDSPGYDPGTRLYFSDEVDSYTVSIHPTPEQITKAVETLWFPFKDFPFVSSVDRGVHLAALLSVITRPAYGTCPGFGYDAPQQGTGKTLLALCTAELAGDQMTAITPWSFGLKDEEIRKRLFSDLLSGTRNIILDNIMGVFNSTALAGYLTSEYISERILCTSEKPTLPNRATFFFTGNNLLFEGDMPRRVLKTRIDARAENPDQRRFKLNPRMWVRSNRREMIEAGLTLIMGRFACNHPETKGSTASFEDWDHLVRQTVCWVSTWDTRFSDPVQAIADAKSRDPEHEQLGDLLLHLINNFGDKPFAAGDIQQDKSLKMAVVHEVLEEFVNGSGLSRPKIGKQLKYRVGRWANGLSIGEAKRSNGSNRYKVEVHSIAKVKEALLDRGIDPLMLFGPDDKVLPRIGRDLFEYEPARLQMRSGPWGDRRG